MASDGGGHGFRSDFLLKLSAFDVYCRFESTAARRRIYYGTYCSWWNGRREQLPRFLTPLIAGEEAVFGDPYRAVVINLQGERIFAIVWLAS